MALQRAASQTFADLAGAPPSPTCSFCGKTAEQVDTLVASDGANICNECVKRAVGVIAQRKATLTE